MIKQPVFVNNHSLEKMNSGYGSSLHRGVLQSPKLVINSKKDHVHVLGSHKSLLREFEAFSKGIKQ